VNPNLVSIIIPCHNPDTSIFETIASARAQRYSQVEIILTNDGSNTLESKAVLNRAARQVDRYIEQPNRGVSAARNAAIQAASGSFIVPLDCQDILDPDFVAACLRALKDRPKAAFVYTDYRVFGDLHYTERLPDYNFYELLDKNTLPYAGLFRREDWAASGGYDELLFGHEDWEFWIRLGACGRFGYHLDRVLWAYRKHGRSLSDLAREHHDELVARIRSKHRELYSWAGYASVKSRWKPAVCVVGDPPATEQTICDWEAVASSTDSTELLNASSADTFLLPRGPILDPQTLELSALAGRDRGTAMRLPDGALVVPRAVLAAHRRDIKGLDATPLFERRQPIAIPRFSPRFLETIWRHLTNAEVLSLDAWLHHPIQSASRLIPLRLKEVINEIAKRPIFDLQFYLKFQPQSVILGTSLIRPTYYITRPKSARLRIALVTPHLGLGGAEAVLLDIASTLDRSRYEILLIATQSDDSQWLNRWREHVDFVFDLRSIVSSENLRGAIYSVVRNWECDTVVVQNALPFYNVIRDLKAELPRLKILDLVHAVGEDWDLVACTRDVRDQIDARIAVSETARTHLLRAGVPLERIHLIRAGIDLQRFNLSTPTSRPGPARVLFLARLEPVKRPMLLVDIARALLRSRPQPDFCFVVAGSGSEEASLRTAVSRKGLEQCFEFLGHVSDVADQLSNSDLVIITSSNEGIPLVLLEAFASGKPVVASDVGAVREVLDDNNGVLIHPGDGEAEAFAAAIQRLLSEPDLRTIKGRNGRRKVEAEYDRPKMLEAYKEVIESVSVEALSSSGSLG
jgi:glycosyltransferase involved in cell wall biosynthesis/GT2 family glycosyltransferase